MNIAEKKVPKKYVFHPLTATNSLRKVQNKLSQKVFSEKNPSVEIFVFESYITQFRLLETKLDWFESSKHCSRALMLTAYGIVVTFDSE